jgi:hypothetical protein
VLAAVALLFVLGLQVQEASHSHAPDDAVAQCVLCKSGPGAAAVNLGGPLPPFEARPGRPAPASVTPALTAEKFPFDARGPPADS